MDPMTELAASSPISPSPFYPRAAGALPADLHHLVDSPDPSVVFAHLAELLVPTLCDQATAVVHVGPQVALRQHLSPGKAEVAVSRSEPDGADWMLTVAKPSHPTDFDGDGPGPHYVAVLTCRGSGPDPTWQEVALIELAAHHAAAVVHQARQVQLLHQQQEQVRNLRTALDSNRTISAAVGVVVATHRLTYEQAFDLLTRTSQVTNRNLATIAETVLQNASAPLDR